MNPRISIITICFNNPDELLRTIESVDAQTIQPFEHYIIDGSTHTDIQQLLQEENIKKIYRRSLHEKDEGISDAFNKGIQLSSGDWIMMLNAGDRFFDRSSLEKMQQVLCTNTDIRWMHAKYQLIRGGIKVIIGKPFEVSKTYRGMRSICHQTMLIHRSLYDKYGGYDTVLKFGMDYDLLLRIQHEPFYFLDRPVIDYDEKGISSRQYLQSLHQTGIIYRKYFGWSFKQTLWQQRLKLLYYLLHSPIGKWLYKLKALMKLENI
jgi:glycosyltransferase involved in cell wall biosynthesis